jgi:hypothetical protein
VIYLDHTDVVIQEAERSPSNDVYLRIPHALMDPVLDTAQKRLMKLFSTTFWCNIEVFQCQQAELPEINCAAYRCAVLVCISW